MIDTDRIDEAVVLLGRARAWGRMAHSLDPSNRMQPIYETKATKALERAIALLNDRSPTEEVST